MQKLFMALSLLSALLFAQIPELIQQYRQRIGGAADELNVIVRNFDEDSRRSGFDRAGAFGLRKKNPERLVREQGQRMEDYTGRLERPNSQQSVLANGVTLAAVLSVAFDYDAQIMSQARAAFTPAFPLTLTSVIFAIIGFILCYGPLLLLSSIFGSRERARA